MWTDRRDIRELLDLVEAAGAHGLEPEDYAARRIRRLVRSVDANGDIRFYRDVYKRDEQALQSLNGPVVLDLPDSV